jgi:hypothetical protein
MERQHYFSRTILIWLLSREEGNDVCSRQKLLLYSIGNSLWRRHTILSFLLLCLHIVCLSLLPLCRNSVSSDSKAAANTGWVRHQLHNIFAPTGTTINHCYQPSSTIVTKHHQPLLSTIINHSCQTPSTIAYQPSSTIVTKHHQT